MLGKFEGENVEQLHKFSKLTLSCIMSEVKSVAEWMKNMSKNDQDKKNLEMKLRSTATQKFQQTFCLPHYKTHEREIIKDCCNDFVKVLYLDLYIKLISILELDGYVDMKGKPWNPDVYLSGSFISVFDWIYHDLKEGK